MTGSHAPEKAIVYEAMTGKVQASISGTPAHANVDEGADSLSDVGAVRCMHLMSSQALTLMVLTALLVVFSRPLGMSASRETLSAHTAFL